MTIWILKGTLLHSLCPGFYFMGLQSCPRVLQSHPTIPLIKEEDLSDTRIWVQVSWIIQSWSMPAPLHHDSRGSQGNIWKPIGQLAWRVQWKITKISLKRFVFFLVGICVYLCVDMGTWVQVPVEDGRIGYPWSWSNRWLRRVWRGCWESNLVLWLLSRSLITAELSHLSSPEPCFKGRNQELTAKVVLWPLYSSTSFPV